MDDLKRLKEMAGLTEGLVDWRAIVKVGKALGEQAYHDEMGGGQGGVAGISSAAFVIAIIFDGDKGKIEEELFQIATEEKEASFKERRGYGRGPGHENVLGHDHDNVKYKGPGDMP